MEARHKVLAKGRWQEFSLTEQMGNIGGEISRAIKWRNKDQQIYWHAIERAFELFDLTIMDKRWRTRLKELLRVREILCDAFLGGKEYKSSLEDLERYFFYFALASRLHK